MKKTILNRVLALLLVLCMACSMTVMVSADETPTAKVSVSASRSGSTVTATIKLSDTNATLYGLQFTVNFDNTKLTYTGADANKADFTWTYPKNDSDVSNANSNGYAKFVGYTNDGSNSTGTMATLTFKVKESAEGIAKFTLSEAKASAVEDGSSKFTCSTSGTSIQVAGYKVTVNAGENGSASVSDSKPFKGDTVTVTTTPDSGYAVDKVSVTTSGGDSVSVSSDGNKHTFTMPDSAVTVSVTFKAKDFSITKGDVKNGSISIDKTSAKKGDTVTVTATPANGYENPKVTVSGVTVTDAGNGKFTFTMPADDVTVNASFAAKTYTISKGDVANGTVSVPSSAKTGETVTVTVSPKAGYEVSKVTASGATVKDAGSGKYTFTMPASNVTVNVTISAKTYKITKDTVKNGSISVPSTAKTGDTVTVTATPSAGYEIGKVTASGATLTDAGNGKYTFTMPANDVKIGAEFAAKTFKISTDKAKHGKIEVASSAKTDSTVEIKLTADKGYAMTALVVKDASGNTIKTSGEGSVRKFTMPASDVSISATFEKSKFKVTVSAGEGGTASADNTTVGYDDAVVITVKPNDHYKVESVKVTDVDGNSVKVSEKEGKYTFNMPNSNVTVKVAFKGEEYAISADKVEHGKISVASKGTYNSKISFKVTADSGYKVSSVKVSADGKSVKVSGSNGKYSFTMPAAKVKITAKVEAVVYTVTALEGENGTFAVGATSGKKGDVITVDTTPAEGYQVNSLTITDAKGNLIPFSGENNAYTFEMPASNVTVAVSFEEIPVVTYALSVTQPENATIALDKTDAGAGSMVTVTVTPDEGYQTVSVEVKDADGNTVAVDGSGDVWTFAMPEGEVTVGATVEPIPEPESEAEPEVESEIEPESEVEVESEIEEEPTPVKPSNGVLTWILLIIVLLLVAVAIIIIIVLKKRR